MIRSAVVLGAAVLSALGSAHGLAALDAAARGADRVRAAALAKAADGHFWAEAAVEGRRVRMLVDTGASLVSLTLDDARALGLDPSALRFDRTVRTAAGETRAARVELASVAVGGAQVERVEAVVLEAGLPASLLGMSYLGRLSRIEATPEALILKP